MSFDPEIFKTYTIRRFFLRNFSNNMEKAKKAFDKISEALKESSAVIAGGSVLSAYDEGGYTSGDIDIYVPVSQCGKLYKTLKSLDFSILKGNIAPAYDQSFFKKNGIMARVPFKKERLKIDLMLIIEGRSVIDVVSNFDLTFCEIWYNGETVNAIDPEGIRNKKGKLRKEYLDSLLIYFNKFIIERMRKYTKRGFKITYDTCENDTRDYTYRLSKKTVSLSDEEQWFVKQILKYILDGILGYNLKKFAKIAPKKYTIEEINKTIENILGDNYNSENLKNFYIDALIWDKAEFFPGRYLSIIERYSGITRADLSINEEDMILDNLIASYNTAPSPNRRRMIVNRIRNALEESSDRESNSITRAREFLENLEEEEEEEGSDDDEREEVREIDNEGDIRIQRLRDRLESLYSLINADDFSDYDEREEVLEERDQLEDELESLIGNNEEENLNEILEEPALSIFSSIKPETNDDRKALLKELETEEAETDFKDSLETLDIDESNIPENCFDIIMQGDEVIDEYLSEDKDNFVFVNAGNILDEGNESIVLRRDDYNVLCFSKEYLKQTLSNPYDNWFYECRKEDSISISWDNPYTYVKIPIDADGLSGYVRLYQIMLLFNHLSNDSVRVFYIVPSMIGNDQKSIEYSVSFRNLYSSNPNYVSANHCQQGSKLLIYDIKICKGNSCKTV